MLKSPEENKSISLQSTAPTIQRKITLKRNLTTITPLVSDTTASESVEKTETEAKKIKLDITPETQVDSAKEKDDENSENKIVKLKVLTEKERLQLRAKKFGAPVDSDIKKMARAERFGTKVESSNGSKTSITSSAVPVSADVLKKRAERFGVSVSTQMIKIENQEKLQKRQERFGASGKTLITPPDTSDKYAEKARLRLERFKTTIK